MTPEQRAKRITENIKDIAETYSTPIDSIKVEEGYDNNNIMAGTKIIVTVTDDDAKALKISRKLLADRWLKEIKSSIGKHRKDPHIPFLKDIIISFWNKYIKPYYLIIILSPIVVGVLYVFSTLIYFYRIKDSQFYLGVKRYLKSIKNYLKRIQQEQWADHIYKSASQIRKFPKIIYEFVIFIFSNLGFIIILSTIGILTFTLIHIIYYTNNFYVTNELEELRNYVATLLNIIGLLLLFGVVSILLNWLSSSKGSTVVLPFDDTTTSPPEEKDNKTGEKEKSNRGKAIADSLVEELHRINHIHTTMFQIIKTGEENIKSERINPHFPPLTSTQENLNSNLTDVATFEAGKTNLSIGKIILILKQLWPFGGVNRAISGSLQNYGSTTRLVVRLDDQNEVKAWEVTWQNYQIDTMTEKIKDLAYKVAMSLAPKITARTWEGFKFFTEAIYSYYQYEQTGDREHLDNADNNCQKAYNAEKKYEKLDNFFNQIGTAYFKEELYCKAERAFLSSLKINPKSQDSYIGLGNVYYKQKKFDDAINQYQLAKKVNRDFPSAYYGLGNVYLQKGDFKKACEQYEKACTINDNFSHSHFWEPYHNLGLMYLYGDDNTLADYKNAEKKFTTANNVNKYLKDAQKLHQVHSGLALTYLFQAVEPLKALEQNCETELLITENLSKAVKEIEKAIDISLDSQSYLYWNLGLIQWVKSYKIFCNGNQNEIDNNRKEAYYAWKQASDIASKNYEKWWAFYAYIANVIQPLVNNTEKLASPLAIYQNKRYLDITFNEYIPSLFIGKLNILLKDVRIIQKYLDKNDETNEPINNLINKLEKRKEELKNKY
ncbi:MAG: tetratricopeptide repeat protein [Nostoc sp. EfeVER01]|uniref:tetratricopeptide repeat protein n=1 Tax=unclassified Nostoc TaxID=2593658 RepID=UPI002AD340B9|nr:tetratricopeptide repeat protein [Nostoc sp. EspVER01]MDZ7947997.1 tetratricopeptide repeat protein [Nostoc sp. EfeVER01]MDZ7991384.1 tetratricopeptide repeat protein [Nostoc sp. EspVER01]